MANDTARLAEQITDLSAKLAIFILTAIYDHEHLNDATTIQEWTEILDGYNLMTAENGALHTLYMKDALPANTQDAIQTIANHIYQATKIILPDATGTLTFPDLFENWEIDRRNN